MAAQDGTNQSLRRQRPVPTLGRPRPIRPVAFVTQPPVPEVVVTQLPILASTQLPQVVSAPQVIIQLIGGSQTPTVTAPQSTPVVVQPETFSVPPATDQPSLVSDVNLPIQADAPQVLIEPKEDNADYEVNAEPEQESELKPELEVTPEPKIAPETLESKSQIPLETVKPQMSYISIQEAAAKPLTRPAPAVLPPLLPKQQPVRELVFGGQTRPVTIVPITVSTQRVTKVPPVIITTSTQKPGLLKPDLICKERNGYYAVENECDSYIECKVTKCLLLMFFCLHLYINF